MTNLQIHLPYPKQDTEYFLHTEKSSHPTPLTSNPSYPLSPHTHRDNHCPDVYYYSLFCLLWTSYKWNHSTFSCFWLLSRNTMFLICTHVVACILKIFFHYMNIPPFLYPLFFYRHLGCFQLLAIINKVTVNVFI